MNQDTLLGAYDKLEKLVSKLPGPLQKAILSEMQPVKELFLEQRPARILITGTSDVSRVEIVNSLFREQIIPLTDATHLPVVPGWETFRRVAGGSVLLLDAREQKNLHWGSGRDFFPPDIVLFACPSGATPDALQAAMEPLVQALVEIEAQFEKRPAVFGVLEGVPGTDGRTPEALAIESALRSHPTIHKSLAQVLSISRWSRFRADGTPDEDGGLDSLLTQIVDELPTQAKLEMARISGVRPAQKKIADTLIKATTAVSAAIGAQPIPLADMPILTTLQASMAAGIIYISGGELNVRSGLKFLGSLGAAIGLGFVLRETARSAAKLVPGFGYAVSGAVAAGGTLAVGRAATAFFIDGLSLSETKKIFRRKPKSPSAKTLNE
ncbi:MAG: hypothetical protein ABIT76_04500 [Chthoniobacterales bacterium]